MAKRKRGFTQAKYKRWLKEGRGQGRLNEYKPWLTIQDVSSSGRSTRLKSIKTDRQHEFLSDLERDYFYILEFSDKVIDIREQFPLLDIHETLNLADELNIKHPTDPVTQEPIVMTTDFVVTINNGGNKCELARTIKSSSELNNKRQIEKFEIERRYWEQREVDWGIVTEKEINKVFAKNIAIIHPFYYLDNILGFEEYSPNEVKLVKERFVRKLTSEYTVRKQCKDFDVEMQFDEGTAIGLFKHLLATKEIVIDMENKFSLHRRMKLMKTNKQSNRLEVI